MSSVYSANTESSTPVQKPGRVFFRQTSPLRNCEVSKVAHLNGTILAEQRDGQKLKVSLPSLIHTDNRAFAFLKEPAKGAGCCLSAVCLQHFFTVFLSQQWHYLAQSFSLLCSFLLVSNQTFLGFSILLFSWCGHDWVIPVIPFICSFIICNWSPIFTSDNVIFAMQALKTISELQSVQSYLGTIWSDSPKIQAVAYSRIFCQVCATCLAELVPCKWSFPLEKYKTFHHLLFFW